MPYPHLPTGLDNETVKEGMTYCEFGLVPVCPLSTRLPNCKKQQHFLINEKLRAMPD